MNFLECIYVVSLCVAMLAGILVLQQKRVAKQLQAIIILVIYATIIEVSVIYFREHVSVRYEGVNNVLPQYNIFTMAEFLFYAYFFRQAIRSRRMKVVINLFLYSFPAFWYFSVFGLFTILEWNSYVFLTGGVFTIFGCLLYFRQLLDTEVFIPVKQNSEFWIVSGLAAFYITVVPFMGMYHFLSKHIVWLAVGLKPMLQISNIIMYTLFAYAFLCRLKTTNTRK
ncbi:MAG: hypothetical protein J7599_16450 [Niabella sp.]|nr:hypothetical protein [Niabella sp.]